MSSFPSTADPTASMLPPSNSTAPAVSGIVVATPIFTSTTAPPSTLVTSTVAPTMTVRAPVLTVLSTQLPVPLPVTSSAIKPQPPVTMTSTSKSSSSKSKKKAIATVTMATAAIAQSAIGSGGSHGENTGRWTTEEHNLFLQGLELHGKGWKKIAGLIKSRTVVQIRTHAQKYFQKLAKAKQNGEDVGMVGGNNVNGGAGGCNTMLMMGDGGRSNGGGAITVSNGTGTHVPSSSISGAIYGSVHTNKRRKQTSGTKRKAIQSVVASATRERNKKLASSKSALSASTPIVAPALAPYLLPFNATNHSSETSNTGQQSGAFGGDTQLHGALLEDSLFRYLTPTPVLPPETQVNPVARQAGANPITLPIPKTVNNLACGEVSPTGVIDLEFYPSWTDFSKDTPSWYSKGSDVDALLDVADTLDWLADTGDLTETYEEAERLNAANTDIDPTQVPSNQINEGQLPKGGENVLYASSNNTTSMSTNTLPRIDSRAEVVVPPLPSLFDGGVMDGNDDPTGSKNRMAGMSSAPSVTNLDEHLFSSPIEESDFVSCIMNETS